MDTSGLQEPLLRGRRGGPAAGGVAPAGGRQKEKEPSGLFGEGSPAAAVALLCSAAIGTGVLTLPYGVSRVGVLPAILLFAVAGLAAYASNVVLFACVRETGKGSYGELMTAILGDRGALVLHGFVCAEGIGAVGTYLVFVMDYVPQICAVGGEDLWCTDRFTVLCLATLVAWPLSCLQGLSALRYISTFSIATLLFTSLVVIGKAPALFRQLDHGLVEVVSDARLGADAFQVLSMACFAFMAHTNSPEVALGLVRPTPVRVHRVVGLQTGLLWAAYGVLGVCGFLSFLESIQQDFMTNYEVRDALALICRCMLSLSLVFACPINICPAVQALFHILEYCTQRGRGAAPQSQQRLYDKTAVRVLVTTACFAISLSVAIRTPRVADLISMVSTFFTAPLMFTFPALMYTRILRRRDVGVPFLLHLLTALLWLTELGRLLRSQ